MSTSDETLTLAEQVRQRIQADGRSVAEIARLSGVSQPFLSQFTSGRKAEISSGTLDKLLPVIGGKLAWKKLPKSDR